MRFLYVCGKMRVVVDLPEVVSGVSVPGDDREAGGRLEKEGSAMDWALVGRCVLALVFGYLLGSIPDTYLLTRWFAGKDLRRLGTGNLTVSNTLRHAGLLAGVLGYVWHILVAFLVIVLSWWLLPETVQPEPAWVEALGRRLPDRMRWLTPGVESTPMCAVTGAFLGQNWPVYLPGSSGRGRTVFSAGLLVLAPLVLAADATLWVLGYALTRKPAVGAIVANVGLPVVMWVFTGSWVWFALGAAAGAVFLVQVLQGGHEWGQLFPGRRSDFGGGGRDADT